MVFIWHRRRQLMDEHHDSTQDTGNRSDKQEARDSLNVIVGVHARHRGVARAPDDGDPFGVAPTKLNPEGRTIKSLRSSMGFSGSGPFSSSSNTMRKVPSPTNFLNPGPRFR